MIRDWFNRLFGKTETERPPKPDPKEETSKTAIRGALAYWPGSNGPKNVAWKESNDGWQSQHRDILYTNYSIGLNEVPYVEGDEIDANPENVTYESEEVLAVFEATYMANPYWNETFGEWRFRKDYDTLEWEQIK